MPLYPSDTLYPSDDLYPSDLDEVLGGGEDAIGPLRIQEPRPPLGLTVEVTSATGRKFLFHADAPSHLRPVDIGFGTRRFDGFVAASFNLARQIDFDYGDIALYDHVTMLLAGGDVVYEGYITALPRDVSDTHQQGVTCIGWMAHAKDRTFSELYVVRDNSGWTDSPLTRKAATPGTDWAQITGQSDATNVSFQYPSQAIGTGQAGELFYAAPPGTKIGAVSYAGIATGTTSISLPTLLGDDDVTFATPLFVSALTFDTARHGIVVDPPVQYLLLNTHPSAPVTPAAGAVAYLSLTLFGTSGVPLVAGDDGQSAITAGAAIRNSGQAYAPLLDYSELGDPGYPIPMLTADETTPYDLWLAANAYSLWGLEVYEGRRVRYASVDLTDFTWQVRADDKGVSLALQGADVETDANGIVVAYTDLATGLPGRVSPDTHSELGADVIGEATRHGRQKWTTLSLSFPTSEAGAVQIGRAALLDMQQPKNAGTITATGHIRDRAGNWQPVSKVRAGDTVAITSSLSLSDQPRLIVETNYTHTPPSVSMAVDNTFGRIEAFYARVAAQLGARGRS